MPESFRCSMCRQTYDSAPATTIFGREPICVDCNEERLRRSRVARSTPDGTCLWCAGTVESDLHRSDRKQFVCRRCRANRDWLLDCIRVSDHPSTYVASAESREAPAREKRQADRLAALGAKVLPGIWGNPPAASPVNGNGHDGRLDRLESMMQTILERMPAAK